ncbi:MAG: hypothetical protein R3Y23_01535 [Bacillota bacterium]
MDAFIESINPAYCYVFAFLLLAIFIGNLVLFVKSKDKLFIIVCLVSFGLFYDMFITALGSVLEPFDAFYGLSLMRHVFHSLLTPLLFVYALQVFRDSGKLLHKKYTIITYAFVAFVIISGIVSIFTSPVYQKTYGGVVQLSIDKSNTYLYAVIILQFMNFGSLIPMIAGSIVSIKYLKDYNIFIATAVMCVMSGLGSALFPNTMFVPSYIGEACIAFFFGKYIYDQHYKKTRISRT